MSVIFCAMAGAAQLYDICKRYNDRKNEEKRKSALQEYSQKGIAPYAFSRNDIIKDWYGERILFPNELVPYFTHNKKALADYAEAIHLDAQKKKYNSCVCVNQPFLRKFFDNYKKKIQIYNNTGVLYY